MRNEQELRQKIREIEESHQCYEWEKYDTLDRQMKIYARNKIWGILYAMGYGEEQILLLERGDLIMPDEPTMLTQDIPPAERK